MEKDEDSINLPAGFWFLPTDSELVLHYLRNKVLNRDLPRNRFGDVNIYKYNPQQLCEMYELQKEHEWFFFTPRIKKFAGGSRPDRVANNGYWKATGAVTPVIHSDNKIVGYKSILVFYEGHRPNSKKTNWIMHEYTLEKHNSTSSKCKASSDMKLDDWVLCKIYNRKRSVNKQDYKKMHFVVRTQGLLNPNPDDHQPLNTEALPPTPPLSPLALFQPPQPPISPTLPPLPLVYFSPPLSQPQRPPASPLLPSLPLVFQPQSTMCNKDDHMATTYSSGGFSDYGFIYDGLCDIEGYPSSLVGYMDFGFLENWLEKNR
ncbi:hypothetical protein Vadar_013773 [Vaccinium darrowii]|uniref:Uncharacterized protein n=1 Tax=Vaccinium darrowii TaxID=229202 RepID=A0ACB7YLR2_9ERIC|nr:hypothetical protein Vadar_013773 [Vaccinium darrowii]